ncbi:unnamed protein product [Microthlaspi erraticum]|uniref:Uncharacterized protein n=1 Tax=Microthlaspi erraticum TaxID=1685480 RepID=A0A6D2I5I7_9BRAS|nr:unnamed protein product [Microthlaspi erraticum]
MRVEDMIPINDSMPEEQLMAIMILKESFDEKARLEEVKALRDENLPWYADIVNFMVSGEVPSSFDAYKRRNSSRMLGITIGMSPTCTREDQTAFTGDALLKRMCKEF